MSDHERHDDFDSDLAVRKKKAVKRPSMWKVLLHNDDYTTTLFVVDVLVSYFHRSHAEATQIMLQVHHNGVGVAGVYPRELAETKVAEVMTEARAQDMPLQLTIERQ